MFEHNFIAVKSRGIDPTTEAQRVFICHVLLNAVEVARGESTPARIDTPQAARDFLYSDKAHLWAALVGLNWEAVLARADFRHHPDSKKLY